MKTFNEILSEMRSGDSMTASPILKPVFDINEKEVHKKVSATVNDLIGEMIKEGNNDYRNIVKILESTVALVSLMNQYDIAIRDPKFKKNVDITSKMMGMDPDEYNILINKELNGYKQAIENQCIALNKLLNTKIQLDIK